MLLFCKIRSTAVELQLTKVQPAEMSGFSRAARGPLVSVNPSVTSERLVGSAFRPGGWEKPATNSWAANFWSVEETASPKIVSSLVPKSEQPH